MEWAALISWVLTASGGFILLAMWLRNGGMSQRAPGEIRPYLILSHFALAATGLVLWIVYVASDSDALAWIAFAVLVVVALIGWTMFAIWYQRRNPPGPAQEPQAGAPAEQRFPVSIVALHGLLAVTTVVLVFIAAIA